MASSDFEWNELKNNSNKLKHHVTFEEAQKAFLDHRRLVFVDLEHSTNAEQRYFCIGKTEFGILTVRFTYRRNKIRIFGAGFWRRGKQLYEEKNNIPR